MKSKENEQNEKKQNEENEQTKRQEKRLLEIDMYITILTDENIENFVF